MLAGSQRPRQISDNVKYLNPRPLVSLVLVLAALVGLIWIGFRYTSARPTPIAPDDPLWVSAIERARATSPTMQQLHAEGREVWVKFPLQPPGGEVEHVWGRLVSLDDTSLTCTIETPPVSGRSASATTPVRVDELEDWQARLPDGSIRGGYTTRAQAAIAKRDGHPVPRHVRDMLPRMVD